MLPRRLAHTIPLAFGLISALAVTAPPAHADSYTICSVQTIQYYGFSHFGITTDGTVGTSGYYQTATFTPPSTLNVVVAPINNPTLPNLAYDNGTPCSATLNLPVYTITGAVCNNDHEAFTAKVGLDANGDGIYGLYDGPDPASNLVSSTTASFTVNPTSYPIVLPNLVLNSVGDIAFETLQEDVNVADTYAIYEAIPTTVTSPIPEPSSWILLGTGLLAAADAVRRRLP